VTLVEFLAPLATAGNREKCLAVLYFYQRYLSKDSLTVEQIRTALHHARVPKWSNVNIADVLNKSGAYVDSPGLEDNRRLWKLTPSGEKHIRTILKLPTAEPEIEHDVTTLEGLAVKVSDLIARGYIEEAVKCISVGALRAAVVFLWTGAIRTLQQKAFAKGTTKLNPAIVKHDPKARTVKKLEDFAYIKDSILLLALQELGILDKGEKTTLEEALNLRNRCGHPTKYKPGISKASSFIEDVVGIVF